MLSTIHFTIAIITVVLVLYSDEQAFFWVRGKTQTLTPRRVTFMHRSVTTGLTLLLISGGLLYVTSAQAYLSTPTFVVKMAMVFVLIINTYFIDRFSDVAITRTFASLSMKERAPLFISGVISFAGWASVFICGLLLS